MARILVLDDDDERHKTFRRNLIGNERVVHVYTYDAAVRALNAERFDVVFLDHDLNDHQYKSLDYATASYGGPRELTGHDVAKAITGLSEEKRPGLAVVHSFNPAGADRMVATLRDAGIPVHRELFCGSIGEGLR